MKLLNRHVFITPNGTYRVSAYQGKQRFWVICQRRLFPLIWETTVKEFFHDPETGDRFWHKSLDKYHRIEI